MFSSEWKQDSESMVKDGQYWRSVFGGARLVLGFIRMTSAAFVILRIVLCICMFVILGLELRAHPSNQDWMLTFGHWTLVLQCSYFVFGSLISLVAVCQDGAGFSHTTPTAVRLFEHMYGAIIPASWVAFGLAIVQYAQAKYCISHVDLHHAQPWLATVLSGSALAAVVIDIGFNRSPYYSSFHGLSGIGFCWGYLLFNFLWQELGGEPDAPRPTPAPPCPHAPRIARLCRKRSSTHAIPLRFRSRPPPRPSIHIIYNARAAGLRPLVQAATCTTRRTSTAASTGTIPLWAGATTPPASYSSSTSSSPFRSSITSTGFSSGPAGV